MRFFSSMCYSYVRLELLEGVVAYHNGHTEKARESLTSAQAKYLQVHSADHLSFSSLVYSILLFLLFSALSPFSCWTNQSHF